MWNKSIRAKLVAVVIAPILLALTIVGTVSYLSAYEEVGEVYDADLSHVAKLIYSLVYAEEEEENEEPHFNSALLNAALEKRGHTYEKYIVFKVWRKDKLLFASRNSLEIDSEKLVEGFSDQNIGSSAWRFFVLNDSEHGYRVVVAEKLAIRMDIIEKFLASIFSPLVLIIPVIILIAGLGLRAALTPLLSISKAVRTRTPSDLSAIELFSVPAEITPLVSSINELLARLAAALQKERRFTDLAAHELRTPIAILKLQAQTALKSADDSERRTILESQVQAADRATHMVKQLLTLARLDHTDIPKEEISLRDAVEQVVQDLQPLAEKKGISMLIRAESNPVVKINPDVLSVILRNLLDNAIKYSPASEKVAVSIQQTGERAALAISDSGPGIPKDKISKVTERFFRIAGHNKPGAGLGLSIVQRGVEIIGGTLDIRNNETEPGLTVTIGFDISAAA